MPELPEVETIRNQLAPLVEGRRLERIEILDARWSHPLAPRELAAALEGRRIERLARRGKYLLWSFEDDVHLAQHLRMTGGVLWRPSATPPDGDPPFTRVRLELGRAAAQTAGGEAFGPGATGPVRLELGRAAAQTAGGEAAGPGATGPVRLAFVDARRCGTGQLLLGRGVLDAFFAARLGLEPLDERFTAEHLFQLARGRTAPIKSFLLDQRRVAGVGNIYADEALFRARLHPRRAAGRLSRRQFAALREGVIDALRAGIDARGATIDAFRDIDGSSGAFQDQFLVHRREGEPCPRCGSPIAKTVVGGRGTYVCPTCQRPPRTRGQR